MLNVLNLFCAPFPYWFSLLNNVDLVEIGFFAQVEGEDCAVMNIKDGTGFHKGKPWSTPKKWNDVYCDLKSHVICQYEKDGFVRAALCEKK